MRSFKQHLKESKTDTLDTSKWKKKGEQMGSNPGGTYSDEHGKDWYVKHSKSDDHAKNENLANHLYQHLGVPTLDHQLITHSGGRLGTASPIEKIKSFNSKSSEDIGAIRKHFAAHAMIANWDTIGLANDNQAHTSKGMTTLDAGGALNYRAQGAPKGEAFGHKTGEWDTLRGTGNPQAHHVFGGMEPHEMIHSAKAVAGLKNDTIHNLVRSHGPGDAAAKEELGNKLINRKKDIIGRANSLAKIHKIEPIKDIDD